MRGCGAPTVLLQAGARGLGTDRDVDQKSLADIFTAQTSRWWKIFTILEWPSSGVGGGS